MFRRIIFTVVAFFALAASAVQARPYADPARSFAENIYGSRVDARGLTLRVGSSGCTSKDSFVMRVRGPERRPTVTAMRVRRDMCKGMFRVVEFTWSYRELGIRRGSRIRVLNPVIEADRG